MKEELKIKSVERKSLTELISEQIQRHILNGIFKPGEKLPPERELARMLNVTRTTLREALKKLEGVKLVLIRQGDGITVQDFRKSDNLFILKELLFEGDRVDSGILGNLLEARKLFLVPMTRLALERADSGDRKEYERLVMELEKNVSDAGLVQELDFNCFELLARASGNLVFVFIFNSIRGIYFSHREIFHNLYGEPVSVLDVHRSVLAALKGKNSKRALKKLEDYLDEPVRTIGQIVGNMEGNNEGKNRKKAVKR